MAAKKAPGAKGTAPTQREHRRGIDVGGGMGQVSTAAYWYRARHFANESEALGAFKLAYQQGLDGMGTSIAAWMGLSTDEYDGWMRKGQLPSAKKQKRGAT